MNIRAAVVALTAMMTSEVAAQALDVKIPDAETGALGFGLLQSFQAGLPAALGSDVNRRTHQFELEYGLADWWKITGVLPAEKPAGEPYTVANFAIENTFAFKTLNEGRRSDFAFGWFSAFDIGVVNKSTNTFVFGPLAVWTADGLTFAINPLLEKTFGRNSVDSTALTYAWQVKLDIREAIGIGIEGYGTIENIGAPPPGEEQEHRIGPVAYTQLDLGWGEKIEPSLGVLFGLTQATPDVAIKFNLGVPLGNLRKR